MEKKINYLLMNFIIIGFIATVLGFSLSNINSNENTSGAPQTKTSSNSSSNDLMRITSKNMSKANRSITRDFKKYSKDLTSPKMGYKGGFGKMK